MDELTIEHRKAVIKTVKEMIPDIVKNLSGIKSCMDCLLFGGGLAESFVSTSVSVVSEEKKIVYEIIYK